MGPLPRPGQATCGRGEHQAGGRQALGVPPPAEAEVPARPGPATPREGRAFMLPAGARGRGWGALREEVPRLCDLRTTARPVSAASAPASSGFACPLLCLPGPARWPRTRCPSGKTRTEGPVGDSWVGPVPSVEPSAVTPWTLVAGEQGARPQPGGDPGILAGVTGPAVLRTRGPGAAAAGPTSRSPTSRGLWSDTWRVCVEFETSISPSM